MVEEHLPGRHAEQPGELPLEADRDIAQADRAMPRVEQRAGDDADRVGEVDDPCGALRPLPGALGDVEDHRDGAQGLGQPARPGGLLADAAVLQRPRLVALPGRLPADPQLEQDRAGAVEALVQAGRPAHPSRVAERAHDPRRHRADHGEPPRVRVDQGELGDLDVAGQPADAVNQFRGVGRSAADDRQLHPNALTSAPA